MSRHRQLATAQLDSHADTCCFGPNARITHSTGYCVNVNAFVSTVGTVKDVPIVSVAVAYDCPVTFVTYVLFFHQVLFFDDLVDHLLCPAQLRHNGITVNDVPLRDLPLAERNSKQHSILDYSDNHLLHIPLKLMGVTSYFVTRYPTDAEIQSQETCVHKHFTQRAPWEPHSKIPATEEDLLRSRFMPVDPNRDIHKVERPSSPICVNDFPTIAKITTQRTSAALDIDSYAPLFTVLEPEEEPEEPEPEVAATSTTIRKTKLDHITLAKRWGIGLETAKRTLLATTQLAIRDLTNRTMTRRLKPTAYQLKHNRLKCTMYADILIGKCTSLLHNKYATVFSTDFQWTFIDPIKAKSDCHYSLDLLHSEYGIPHTIVPDNAKELTEGDFRRKNKKANSHIKPIEPHTPNQNLCEGSIRELLRIYRHTMRKTNSPECLWDVCLMYCSNVRRSCALNIKSLRGDVPETLVTGNTKDISYISEFGWYDWVWYLGPEDESKQRLQLGRYCGPSYDVGSALCARILNEKAQFLSRTSVFPLNDEEARSEPVKEKQKRFTETLNKSLERMSRKSQPAQDAPDSESEKYADVNPKEPPTTDVTEAYEPILDTDPKPAPLVDDMTDTEYKTFDKYLTARVRLSRGGEFAVGTVVNRKRDLEGKLIGASNNNPILDTSVYEVEFEDGITEEYTANIIAESIYEQVDADGNTIHLIDEIIEHEKDCTAVDSDNRYFLHNGRHRMRETTRGWKLLVQWKDGTTTWMNLKDLKDSDPVRVAEYAQANQLLKEPAFAWWCPHVLKKRDRLIKAMKKRYFKKHQKYGIELPKTVQRAYEIDKETGTTFWADAIKKEMANVMIAFEILDDENQKIPPEYSEITGHMVFDIKPDFTRKARYVAGGHLTDPPASITYASVVSRESVRIAFLIAALNGLEVLAADAQNAYLMATPKEKYWLRCGPEFGPVHQGKRALIVRALYGLRGSGSAFRAFTADILRNDLGFTMCKADNDVWMRKAIKPNGVLYYEYMLVYVDDFLILSMKPWDIVTDLQKKMTLKKESIKPPDQYLGASVSRYEYDEGKSCWAMGSEQYVKEAIRNVDSYCEKKGLTLKTGKYAAKSVFPAGYKPELDFTAECDDEDTTFFQEQIGILRWAVELGRIDIATEVSMLAAYCASPRVGHIRAVLHMYSYLKHHTRSRIVFDPSPPPHPAAPKHDWSEFYPDAKLEEPPDKPEPRGESVVITTFEDSDHASDTVTRRSRTGVLIFVNRAPIVAYSKKQNSIETSSFGSEFTALKTAVELTEGIVYKLKMMGVPVEGHAFIMGDNMSVISNSSIPESMLKKKSNSIAYHYVRERCAMDFCRIVYENTKTNLADMLTKVQSGPERMRLVKVILR